MTILYDLADPRELVGFVREVVRDVDANQLILSNFLPNVNQDDITYRYTVEQTLSKAAAKVRAWDTEAPIAKRQGLERRSGELVPISEKIRLGEEESLRLRRLREGGDNRRIIDAIYDDADNLARAVARRIEMMRGEIIEFASLSFNENGVIQTVDFERDADLEPAALAGTAMWSVLDDSDPVENLTTWSTTWADFNGGARPAFFILSSAIMSNLLRNAKVRELAASALGTPQVVSEDVFASVLRSQRLPQPLVYDVAVDVDGTSTEVLSDDKVYLVGGPNRRPGRTLAGPTAEAIELAEARQINVEDAAGVTAVVEKTVDPVSTWTKVAASTMAVMTNPNAVLVADVQ